MASVPGHPLDPGCRAGPDLALGPTRGGPNRRGTAGVSWRAGDGGRHGKREGCRTVRTTLEAHLGSRQVARVVYGSIIGLALVVVVEAHPPSTGVLIGWFLGTAVAVALAEVYAEVIGVETRERHRVTRAQLREMRNDALAVAFGVA